MKHVHKLALSAAILLAVGGCVSQKKRSDAPWAKRRWQDMNSHYNGYFNANVMYEEALAKLNEAHKDNYNQILDVYPYEAVTADEAKQVKDGCDNIVKKMAKTVALHRASEWVDDCYLMVGKAYFLKQDYEAAEEALRFSLDEFNPEKPAAHRRHGKMSSSEKKRAAAEKSAIKKEKDDKKKSEQKAKKKEQEKKKKEAEKKRKAKAKAKKKGKATAKKMDETSFDKTEDKPSSKKEKIEEPDDQPKKPAGARNPYAHRFGHRRPAYPELQLWMGRTLIERDKNDEAEFLFNQLNDNPFFPTDLRDDLAMAEAHNFLQQKQWDKAVAPLEQAIKLTKKRRQRARLAYILAQIHSRAGRSTEAVAAYQQVLKSGPVYDMEFSARLHMMLDAYYNGTASGEATQKGLQKMLKDDKNYDYRDQIYFILAQIDLKDGDRTAAIDHLRKSLAASSSNKNQKAESYWAIAKLYFESEKFVEAKLYYDSTLTVLPNTDPRYAEASRYAKSLTEIAGFITAVVLEDSLRAIYNMSDEDKKKLATKIKKDREAEIEAATKAAASTSKPGNAPKTSGPLPPLGGPNNFYFYNDAVVKKGKRDFARLWGDRKNEDNWQRSRRADANSDSGTGTETASTDQPDLSKAELDDLLPGIPKSANELAALDSTESSILFKLGKAFRDQLENNKRSSETHERMFADFPQYVKTNELEAWFYLYLSFTDLGNTAKAKEYYDKIVGKYPNSSYAKSLTDPNFKDLTTQRARELNAFYKETYRIFQSGDFASASARCTEAEKKFGTTNALATKFALLSTMCAGSAAGKDGYCPALKDFIAKHPDTDEKTRATEIARVLGCEGFQAAEPDKKGEDGKNAEGYTLENDKLHYFLIVLSGGDVKLDNVKADISDYNRQYHKLDQLRVSNIYLGTDTETPIIVIRKFDNRQTAMAYYDELTKAKDFIKEKRVKTEFFAITQNNYRVLLGKKKLDDYRSFFGEKYLK